MTELRWDENAALTPIEPWTQWVAEHWACRTCGAPARDGLHMTGCKESAVIETPRKEKSK